MATLPDTYARTPAAADDSRRGKRRRALLALLGLLLVAASTGALMLSRDVPSSPGANAPGPSDPATAAGGANLRTARPSSAAQSTDGAVPATARPSPSRPLTSPGIGAPARSPATPPASQASGPDATLATPATPSPTAPAPTPAPSPSGGPAFAIRGDVEGLLPGRWSTIRLVVSNPTTATMRITSVTVTVASDSTPPGCRSAVNIGLVQSSVSAGAPLVVPAGGTASLEAAPRAPQIALLDLPGVNQDACQGASFALSYAGTAEW